MDLILILILTALFVLFATSLSLIGGGMFAIIFYIYRSCVNNEVSDLEMSQLSEDTSQDRPKEATSEDSQPKNATSETPQSKSEDPQPKEATSKPPQSESSSQEKTYLRSQPESYSQPKTKKEDVDQPTFLQRLAKLQGFIMFLHEEQNISVEEKLKSLEKKCDKIMVKLSANSITDGTKAMLIEKQIQLLESFKYLGEKYLRHELNENERKLFEEGEWEKLGYEVTVDGVSLRRDLVLFDSLTIRCITEYCRQGSKETRRRVDILEKDNAYLKTEFAKRKEETEYIRKQQEDIRREQENLKIQFAKDKEQLEKQMEKDKEQLEKQINDLREEQAQTRKEIKIAEEWLKQGWQPHKKKYEEQMKQQKQQSMDEISISKENSL